ncbi:MAG TPA: response regulator transcription factor [Candidatus Scatomorpha intestinavium]|uniref:Stage 0 sporulation protein A homolog n=1 Tax=Candidatus Scatomorpha intestinavium TaxID=2840922 RepID=A0A9D1CSX0_9FIRM|nr:response regulator transcription factor [Candidatus Scatomorpha intestinavium]
MYRIFLVEDDAVIASAVKRHLESWGCEVGCAADFSNVLAEFESFSPQLVLLDISLPFYNGYHWCSEIRRVSDVPVMFISAASDSMNIVMAMNMGADDFIAKPFDLDVLTAKIQALMRRVYGPGEARNVIERGGAVLDPGAGTLSAGGGSVELTKNELRILKTLMESRGIVSRDELMLSLWKTDSFVDENTLTVNVGRLRRKLEGIGLSDFIKTKKGLGYTISE